MHFKMSSTICFNLDQSKILSSGNELKPLKHAGLKQNLDMPGNVHKLSASLKLCQRMNLGPLTCELQVWGSATNSQSTRSLVWIIFFTAFIVLKSTELPANVPPGNLFLNSTYL